MTADVYVKLLIKVLNSSIFKFCIVEHLQKIVFGAVSILVLLTKYYWKTYTFKETEQGYCAD